MNHIVLTIFLFQITQKEYVGQETVQISNSKEEKIEEKRYNIVLSQLRVYDKVHISF